MFFLKRAILGTALAIALGSTPAGIAQAIGTTAGSGDDIPAHKKHSTAFQITEVILNRGGIVGVGAYAEMKVSESDTLKVIGHATL